jgi:nitrate/TMAO reductase-like tetraheme cytochrome c subunit
MTDTDSTAARAPRLTRNFTSLIGTAIVVASLASILFLFLAEMLGTKSNPYLGIFAYIIFPGFLILGLLIVLTGAIMERRRRRRLSPDEVAAYPKIDLNDPRRRRSLFTFLGLTFLFIFVSAFGSYRAYEYTNSVAFCGQLCHSVMNPEFVAYQASPHARVRCVDCHVGPGADWYVKSKLSGLYQVYSVWFEKYERPIPTPVHSLRPAQETCEQCHWPEKFFGAQLKVFNRYGYDETNTLRQIRMLINTGGGSPTTGLVTGIHWHMNIANEITYIASDNQRQEIPWVRMKDREGNVTEFFAAGVQMSPEEVERAAKRKMDCVDCHNRPSHIYVQPDRAVNESFVSGRLDASLPYLKQQAVEALSKPYNSTQEAVSAIASTIDQYYRTTYPAIYEQKREAIGGAIKEIQRIFQTYFFPEMKVDWQTHPDNIGHYYAQGCFRCHDGQHTSPTGRVIRADCNICHTVLDQTEGGQPVKVENGAFVHPVDMGDMTGVKCTDCHTGKGMKSN